MTQAPLRLVVMLSGSGSTLQAIIDAIQAGPLNANIAAVVSDKATAYGLERARRAGIDTCVVAPRDYADKTAWQHALQTALDAAEPELIAMAGFMRVLAPTVAEHFAGRIINIHPSLLPDYRGLHTHRRVLDAGEAEHGSTLHFVTPELDGGPLILQARLHIARDDTEESLAERVHAAEHKIYPLVLNWFAQRRIKLYGDHVLFDGEPMTTTAVRYFK